MNKKGILIGIIVFIVVTVVGIIIFFLNNNANNIDTVNEQREKEVTNDINQENEQNQSTENNKENTSKTTLVVYYSATNHTKTVAEKIAQNLKADVFEIKPVNPYSEEDLNWNDSNSRVSKEHNDESQRNIELASTTVENWESYNTVIIGYPIWWGVAAWPVNTFVKNNNFTGKTVIPFCTSSSSGLGQSGSLLQEMAGTGNWQTGIRFNSNPSDSMIKTWTDEIQ